MRNCLNFKQLGGGRCVVVFHSEDPTYFEFPAFIYLSEKAKSSSEDFFGFYFHTKGITWQSVPKVYRIDKTWRKMAEYFIFDRWRMAVAALCRGYDAYGVNYYEVEGDYFRLLGCNFSWFRSAYVKTLPTLQVNHEYRSETETWLLSQTHNVYCPFVFTGNMRSDPVPEELYLQGTPRHRRLAKAFAAYFTRFAYVFRLLLHAGHSQRNPLLKKGV